MHLSRLLLILVFGTLLFSTLVVAPLEEEGENEEMVSLTSSSQEEVPLLVPAVPFIPPIAQWTLKHYLILAGLVSACVILAVLVIILASQANKIH